MCTVKKFQLNPTHRAAVSVGTQNPVAKVYSADGAQGLSDGIPAWFGNASGNLVDCHNVRRSSNAIQQINFGWYFAV